MTGPGLPTGPDLDMEVRGLPLRVLVVQSRSRSDGVLEELSSLTGFSVECARHPDDVLQRLRAESFDVIVLELPNALLEPDELYRRIVDADPDRGSRTVFLANDLSDPQTRRFLTVVGRPFLTSPVNPDELYDLVLRTGLGDRDA